MGTVIGNAKTHYAQTWHQSSLSSVARYQPLQPEHVLAPYLSADKGFKSRKLISRLRCGCHGLHVDTGRYFMKILVGFWLWHSRCLGSNINAIVFSALLVQQRMNIILCLIALHIVPLGTDSSTVFPTLSSFFTLHDPKVIASFLKEC